MGGREEGENHHYNQHDIFVESSDSVSTVNKKCVMKNNWVILPIP